MSGLVCVFARDGAVVDAADVDAVLQRQAHRGPDGLRGWCDGSVGLGHAALDPTGQGAAVEPLVGDGGRLGIVGDLRIDNRNELIEELELPSRDRPDTEIVLAAYRRWGLDAPRRLEGAFAFAIWDAVEQRVFCARDHLGVKPMTYHLSARLLVCASEAEAVPCHRLIPRRINEERVADFLVSELEGIDHTSTFFDGVVRLPPAHFLVVDRDGHRLQRYWHPDVETELRLDSDEAYAEAFSATFGEAVTSCAVGVERPSLLLSGGIDSSAVAAVAASLADSGKISPLATVSFVDDDWDRSPETSCIRRMIEDLGGDGVTASLVDVDRMIPAARRAFLDCGEPFDSFMVVPNLLFSMAAGEGSRMVLDGVDGDIVASIGSPAAYLLRRGRPLRAWREAAARHRLYPSVSHPLRALAGGALRAWVPRGLHRTVRRFRNRGGGVEAAIRESLIDQDFARRAGLANRLGQLSSHGRDDPRGDPRVAHARAVTHPYVAVALERYDRVAARCGVEVRHPFFDLRLVKLCLSLPWNLKVRNGWTKFVLRLAMKSEVTDEVRWRHDYGDVLWRATSRVIAEERVFLRSILDDADDRLGPYVDHSRLEVIRRVVDGNPNAQEEIWIWEASTLAKWLARFRS